MELIVVYSQQKILWQIVHIMNGNKYKRDARKYIHKYSKNIKLQMSAAREKNNIFAVIQVQHS